MDGVVIRLRAGGFRASVRMAEVATVPTPCESCAAPGAKGAPESGFRKTA